MDAITPGSRLLAGAVANTAVITACAAGGAEDGGVGSAASCLATLKFRGKVYNGTSLRTHPPYNRVGRFPLTHP
jgi:hypothetical protein